MPDLNFQVEAAEPQQGAAVPLLLFKLRITEAVAAGAAIGVSRGSPRGTARVY